MIEAGLPFIASSKQMYFPFLGIALADGKGRARNRSIVSVDEDSPRGDIKNLARKTVEDTINELLDEEADQLVGIGCYERSAGRDWGDRDRGVHRPHWRAHRAPQHQEHQALAGWDEPDGLQEEPRAQGTENGTIPTLQ